MKEIEKIDTWLEAMGWPETRLGQKAAANQFAVPRIRSGTASVDTLWQVMDYIRKNPAGKK